MHVSQTESDKRTLQKKSESGRENPREFWDTYRPILNSKTKQANDIVLKENEVPITNKKQIAELRTITSSR